jgi:Cu2+-exporting ATPase
MNGYVLEASTLVLLTLRGDYVAGALLTWLRSLGDYVVARSVRRTRRSLRNVVAAPDQIVARVADGQRTRVRAASLTVGDVVAVGAGRHVPVDGTVVGGEALVNQQTMTGEALPVERRTGDPVFAATTVEHGEIEVRIERVGLETAVGRIVEVIEAAADEKSGIQVFAERLADREVARTLTLAGLGTLVSRDVNAATAILVADYGTAARVGIPTSVATSLWRASHDGILIKGPRALENLARVNTVVFDKTGTLTSGVPHVTSIVRYSGGLDEDDLIRLVAAAEGGFRHPVARAVARLARERGIAVPTPTMTSQKVGLGVDVQVEGKQVLVGSRRFMDSLGVNLAAATATEAAAHDVGASPNFVAIDGELAGVLVLQDQLRDDARDAVRALRERKMRNVILLSGDHPEPSRVIADLLGLRHHYAELLPADKARLIRELKAEGRVVAMVGDGVNDALALNEADVGIAVPGGAEVATEAADVVLLRGGLVRVVRALDLARDSVDGVRRTLGIAARANLAVVGLASFGLTRPLSSILISHGSAVAAALVNALGRGRDPGVVLPSQS